MNSNDAIAIKPHHFVDILTALGDGQSDFQPHPYGHAVHSVARAILDDPDCMLHIDFGADAICMPCRHNVDGYCDDTIDTSFRPKAPTSKREYNLLIDTRWAKRLGIQEGDQLTARELCKRIRDTAGNLNDIYCENPIERTVVRQAKLQRGIASLLDR